MLEHSPSLLPRLPPHRPSAATKAAYQDKVAAFCAVILELQSRLDFAGSRGWAYILEGERFIDKDEIDAAQDLVNACRKRFTARHLRRGQQARRRERRGNRRQPGGGGRRHFQLRADGGAPLHPVQLLGCVQVGVEKSNVKNLFARTCAGLYAPIANL